MSREPVVPLAAVLAVIDREIAAKQRAVEAEKGRCCDLLRKAIPSGDCSTASARSLGMWSEMIFKSARLAEARAKQANDLIALRERIVREADPFQGAPNGA